MIRRLLRRLAPALAAALLSPRALAAAEEQVAPAASGDIRGKLMIAYSAVFLLVLLYLVISHRKGASLEEDVDFLRARVRKLEEGAAER